MLEQEHWQWQEPGTAWRGVGVYHITLTVTSRQPLLGKLVVPDGNPEQARVERTEMGHLLLECQRSVPVFHPEIQILQYCLMPDHLHSIWFVRRPMSRSIRQVAQGFWQATKKLGRAHSYIMALEQEAAFTDGTTDERACGDAIPHLSSFVATDSRENPLCLAVGVETYKQLPPVFAERPFIRPLSRRGQLQAMLRYVQMNPQRLATKQLMPGFFRVQQGIVLAGRTYSGVGNVGLLQARRYDVVHVRSIWVRGAERGDSQPLRDYMNGCVIKARKGVVMVSPFVSPQEKQVMQVLIKEQWPFILLTDNGFRDYYKPADGLFDACAAGRVLILSPWLYDSGKRHISRADSVALNAMAEEILTLNYN